MPINADLNGKQYVLGKGRIFFDRYPTGVALTAATQGLGERYIGNTPEFTTSSSSENLDHYDSDSGIKVKDDSVQLSFDRTGKLVTDSISTENLALLFLGERSTITQTASTGLTTTVTAKRGMFYQLGASESLPQGVRKVTSVVVTKGAGFSTPVTMAGNYQIDEDLGRIYIEDDAVAINDEAIRITFNTLASTREVVISGSTPIYGALRLVSDNPKGANRDYFFPYVKLAPDGDYALKGEEWQQIGFQFEILKKASSVEAAYVDGRATVV